MKYRSALWLAALLGIIALLPDEARAQERGRIRINTIRVGFPSSLVDSQFKAGNWSPVYVDVTAGPAPVTRAKLTIEAVDTDDVRNNYTVDVAPLEPGESATIMAYTKPGSAGDEITAVIRIDDVIAATKSDMAAAIALDHHLYLTIGGRIPGIRRALAGEVGQPGPDAPAAYTGPERVASLDDIRQFPTHWYGYEGVDLMVFTTSDRDFLTAFLNEREGRKEALADWVRRGGHLIVMVGRNQDLVAQIDILQNLLPVTVKGIEKLPLLRGPARWTDSRHGAVENQPPKANPTAPRPAVEIATLLPKSNREVEKLLTEPDTNQLLVVRGAYGMGKVTVIGLDLDRPPFTSWIDKGQNEFWKRAIAETAPPVQETKIQNNRNVAFGSQENPDIGTSLQANIEEFSDMPVISFGWVALFILIYILIVGPLDYFFLKKVVKRLELTWITFPTVVITISVVAYFTAYWLKGNDQRINKIDVLDVDLHTQKVYGTTWFSIFSPRIQNYIVGLQPADALSGSSPAAPPSVTLSWMGRPEAGWGGTGRARSQGGLFRRAYDYAPDATGLIRVPIQVWSTKSFVASWEAPFDPAKPIIAADLKHPRGNTDALTGSITSNFPVPLEGAAIYQTRGGSGRWYTLENLLPGVPQRLDNLLAGGVGEEMDAWLSSGAGNPAASTRRSGKQSKDTEPLIKALMFQQYERTKRPNNLFRNMDESWRLPHKDEVILFARIPMADGESESVASSLATQTALWLGALPGPGAERKPLQGSMSQASYVRIFIPVLQAD